MMETAVKLLDQNTANQIAAGEVVEKPASVVKELVENALDAGASNIEVTIYEGGIDYIRVVDNGSGMSEENAKLAVLRHATSKIRTADDLLCLHSLGFRGEALPSIASVSKFQLLTRLPEAEFATSVTIDGGTEAEVIATGGNIGTSVTVQDLFFNVPARRKFLKTVGTEGRYINEVLTKIALSRPQVHCRLLNNDKEVLNTPGNGDLMDTIAAIYGKKVREELMPVDFFDQGVTIKGYISKPTLLKGTRQWQSLYVNGRSINSPMLAKAIDHAYQSQIPKSGFPLVVLDLELDAANIDVNVHPQKSEVKFGDDGAVYRLMYHALTEALTKPMRGTAVEQITPAKSAFSYGSPTAKSSNHGSVQEQIWKTPTIAEAAPAALPFVEAQRQSAITPLTPAAKQGINFQDTDNGIDVIWPLGQIDRVFIVAQSETALYLIDQHAAHERVMYDKLVKNNQNIPSQQLLLPLYIDVTPQELALIEDKRQEFLALGVDVDAGGETVLRVAALPSDVKNEQAEDFIREILTLLSENKDIKPSDLREEVLHYAACHSAIRAGELLNMNQMRQLILQLLNTEHPFTCPHGRPCMIEITSSELFKMFKRT